MKIKVKRTERGWPGHLFASHMCQFRRNTLLKCGDIRIVVSTIGNLLVDDTIEPVGHERYHETMAFHAKRRPVGRYWDADVNREIYFESNWHLPNVLNDNLVNEMHENVVKEITKKLKSGYRYETT